MVSTQRHSVGKCKYEWLGMAEVQAGTAVLQSTRCPPCTGSSTTHLAVEGQALCTRHPAARQAIPQASRHAMHNVVGTAIQRRICLQVSDDAGKEDEARLQPTACNRAAALLLRAAAWCRNRRLPVCR